MRLDQIGTQLSDGFLIRLRPLREGRMSGV